MEEIKNNKLLYGIIITTSVICSIGMLLCCTLIVLTILGN